MTDPRIAKLQQWFDAQFSSELSAGQARTCLELLDSARPDPSGDATPNEAVTAAVVVPGVPGEPPTYTALRELLAWVDRGIDEDRLFEVRYLVGIEHPWCVRVEHDPTGWCHEENTCTTLPIAVKFALAVAEKVGHP